MILEDDLLIKIHKLLENDEATPEILFNSISLLETLLKTGIASVHTYIHMRRSS